LLKALSTGLLQDMPSSNRALLDDIERVVIDLLRRHGATTVVLQSENQADKMILSR
jgi:hypothetical protein